jgi:hypothetical protein
VGVELSGQPHQQLLAALGERRAPRPAARPGQPFGVRPGDRPVGQRGGHRRHPGQRLGQADVGPAAVLRLAAQAGQVRHRRPPV